ncbi:MAG: hypothetical protein HW386_2174 [Gammaproteobacteria bacterium]|nr:hypothetical protein [Gammaproteobacteria bacterium]
MFQAYANRLKFKNLFILTVSLFVIDLLIPDFIPMIDEIILALIAVLLTNWKKEDNPEQPGTVIEGEVVKEEDK